MVEKSLKKMKKKTFLIARFLLRFPISVDKKGENKWFCFLP